MFVEAPRSILPGILHVDPNVVEAFDLDSLHLEEKVRRRESSPCLPERALCAVWWLQSARFAVAALSIRASKLAKRLAPSAAFIFAINF